METNKTYYICLNSGLSNRLRTIIGFTYIAEKINCQIIFHWNTENKACNGRFHEIFKPFPCKNVKIIDQKQDKAIKYYFIGQATIPDIILYQFSSDVPQHLKGKSLWHTDYIRSIEQNYQRFKPLDSISMKVRQFCDKLDTNFIAMHVRTTDHVQMAKDNNQHTTFEEFDKFLQLYTGKQCYLATDSLHAQQRFPQCVKYAEIKESDQLRQTSLEEALIDVLIASKAQIFKGSGYSSYSELIRIFQRLQN